ncbi:MAG: iron ABC transporter permease [Treponema sp.]|nr:iron ABC transporter permease [Treponema sp.]
MILEITLYTLQIAVLSTIISAVIGIPAAFFTSHRVFPGRRLLLASSAVPLCVPPLIIALGYVSFFGINGTLNSFLKSLFEENYKPFSILYSSAGIVIAQGFYNFPLVTKILNDAWSQLPKEQENAARLLGTSEQRIFFTITLPQLSGAIAAACIPVFLFSFFSFMIVLLFSPVGKSTLEVEIYHSIRSTLNIQAGGLLIIVETAIALTIVFVYSRICQKSQTSAGGIAFVERKRCLIGKSLFETRFRMFLEICVFFFLLILILLFFVSPGLSILISGLSVKRSNQSFFSLAQFISIFKDRHFYESLFNTFWVGLCTGFLSCNLAFVYSVIIKINRKQKSALLQTLPLIPMAISSVSLGWCMGLLFHHGNPFMLIILQTILYWPIAYRQLQNGINRIDLDTDKAALLLSKNKLDAAVRVYLPSCKRVLLSAFGFCFAVSAGDATLPLMLSIPKFNTLALYTYKLASSYRFNQACASGVILALLCAIFAIFND